MARGCRTSEPERPALVEAGTTLPSPGFTLPDVDGEWGEIHLNCSARAVARAWTDSGKPRESRQLKHRAQEDVRPVPCHPLLVEPLKAHMKEIGNGRDGRFFRMQAGTLPKSLNGQATASTSFSVSMSLHSPP